MGTKFTYALILTICGAAFSLLLYFTGFETEKLATGQMLRWIGIVYTVVILWMGIKAVREETPERGMSYGRAVGTGVIISLIAGILSGIYTYIHYTFINVEYAHLQMQMIREQWAAAGMSEAQMEQMEPMTRMFIGPVMMAIMTPIMTVIFGTIISLILAAFLKRPATVDAPPPM